MKMSFFNKGQKADSSDEVSVLSPRHSKVERSSFFYLSCFLLFVVACVLVALVLRFFFLVKNSTFSTSSYSVLVKSKNPFIIALDNTLPNLSLISVPVYTKNNRMKESLFLGVPIDGEIVSKENISKDSFPSMTFLLSMVFRPWAYSYHDMTIIDALRLTSSSLSMSPKKGEIKNLKASQLYDIFKEPNIINEKVSIEIVNATSVQGLAGGVGQILKNIGCNVVSITSADEQSISRIVANNSSVTLTRVSHVLGIVPSIEDDFHGITDLKVILGQDFGDRVK